MAELEKCSGCQQMKEIVSCDAYGQYCERCDRLNFLEDNDLPEDY